MRPLESRIIFMLLLLALAPYFAVCFYALPYADDFCYAWTSAEHISFIGRFMRQYMGWSGRYSAHVLLCTHPLAGGHLFYYHLADLAALGTVLFGMLVFFRRIVADAFSSATIALVVLLFYLTYIPQLSDGVYWYTGVCNYELSNVCFILHLSILFILVKVQGIRRTIYFTAAALLLIASIGFNEIAAAIIPSYYLFASAILYKKRKEAGSPFPIFLTLFFISLVSFAFLVSAPGNHVRSSQFHTHFAFLHSVLFGSLQTVRFIGIWLCTIPTVLLSMLAVARANRLSDSPIFRFDYRLILGLIIFTVFMSAFMPYYTTGILGQHRTINYVFFYFILLWLWLLISISKKYSLHQRKPVIIVGAKPFAVILISIIVMALTANGGRILRDAAKGTFTAYNYEFKQRRDSIKVHPGIRIVPLKNVPQSLHIVDADADSTYWVNKAIRTYTERVEMK